MNASWYLELSGFEFIIKYRPSHKAMLLAGGVEGWGLGWSLEGRLLEKGHLLVINWSESNPNDNSCESEPDTEANDPELEMINRYL